MTNTIARARRIGARTAMILAALLGAGLALGADEPKQLVVVLLVTALVIAAARGLGARLAVRMIEGGLLRALGLGALGGLACLLLAAPSASLCFAVWHAVALWNVRVVFHESVGLFALVFGVMGVPFATVLGTLHGLLVHRLAAPSRRE